MLAVGDKKELILLVKPKGSHRYELICFGRKAHYRKDGTCAHTEQVLARMKPWHRSRTKVHGFGKATINGATRKVDGGTIHG